MINYQTIIDYYYPAEDRPATSTDAGQKANGPLRDILLQHSRSVAEKAVAVVDKHPELGADRDFVYAAAMIHDIGIVRTDADGIHCYGTEPYLKHGVLGAAMLHEHDFGLTEEETEALARICARHTGTGLTAKAIRNNNLPLPEEDLVPETIEEQIVCYADKFFSKTKLYQEKPYEKALKSVAKFGDECAEKLAKWHQMFA